MDVVLKHSEWPIPNRAKLWEEGSNTKKEPEQEKGTGAEWECEHKQTWSEQHAKPDTKLTGQSECPICVFFSLFRFSSEALRPPELLAHISSRMLVSVREVHYSITGTGDNKSTGKTKQERKRRGKARSCGGGGGGGSAAAAAPAVGRVRNPNLAWDREKQSGRGRAAAAAACMLVPTMPK
jgi:hypothetical protein